MKLTSKLWYILPILLGLIGGIVGYMILRHSDPTKAKKSVYLGIVLTAIGIIINVMLLGQITDLTPDFKVHV